VSASRDLDGAPGGLVRISRPEGAARGTHRIARAAFPTSRASVVIPTPTEGIDRAAEIEAMRAALVQLGLDADEAAAFGAAWDCELFGVDPSVAQHPSAMHPLDDVLLYVIPQSAVDAMWQLDASPPPRAIRRAFLVRVDLGPT
jgi:hypothetical protein